MLCNFALHQYILALCLPYLESATLKPGKYMLQLLASHTPVWANFHSSLIKQVMASKTSTAPMKVGILSVGDMGVGIARLLIAHGIAVATNCQGRRCVRGRQQRTSLMTNKNPAKPLLKEPVRRKWRYLCRILNLFSNAHWFSPSFHPAMPRLLHRGLQMRSQVALERNRFTLLT